MNSQERKILQEYITHREAYYLADVDYWKDEFRQYPFPAIASSLSNALLRLEVFEDFRNQILSLLDDQ